MLFEAIVNELKPLAIVAKSSKLDVAEFFSQPLTN